MKILHVTDTSIFNYDGISTYINELLDAGYQSGEQMVLFSTVPLDPTNLRKVNHFATVKEFKNVKFFSSDKFNISFPTGMKKAMYALEPDMVWIHTIGPLGLSAARLAKKKYPVVYTKHCFDGELWVNHLKIPRGFQWFFHLVADLVERVVLKNTDVAFYHFDKTEKIRRKKFFGKFTYMPPPLNGRFLQEKSYRKYKEGNKVYTIGFCGRLDPEKSIDQLFKAVDIFQKRNRGIKLKLLLIGDGIEANA